MEIIFGMLIKALVASVLPLAYYELKKYLETKKLDKVIGIVENMAKTLVTSMQQTYIENKDVDGSTITKKKHCKDYVKEELRERIKDMKLNKGLSTIVISLIDNIIESNVWHLKKKIG